MLQYVWYHVKSRLRRALSSGSSETLTTLYVVRLRLKRFFFLFVTRPPTGPPLAPHPAPPLVGRWCFPLFFY